MSNADQTEQDYICFMCVGEAYISQEVSRNGVHRQCSYCNKDFNCYSIKVFSERVHSAFDQHFVQTDDQPNSERAGESVVDAIMSAAGIPEPAAEDVRQILNNQYGDFDSGEEPSYSSESYYEKKEG